MKTWTSIAVILSLVLGACTAKKRNEALPYGGDKDLLTIGDYADKEFTIQTQGILSTSQDKKSLKLNSDKGNKTKLRAFDFVKYEASGDALNLLDKSLVMGRTNHQYHMRYEFEGTLLKVYKIGSDSELSAQEIASAISDSGGTKNEKKVPVVSYRVSYFTIENQRNEKDETTPILKLTGQDSKTAATHFKIDYNSKSAAKYLPKELVFESTIFDGDWYFAKTVASQNYNRKGYNGYMHTEDESGITSSKVRAQKRETAIDFINTNIDERLKTSLADRKENQNIAFSIKSDFVDYRMTPEGRGTSIHEEIFAEGAWDHRKYVKLKLGDDTTELVDIQFDDGYFSILTFDRDTKEKYRTALYNVREYRKHTPAYTPKIYLKEDKQVFGFFAETKNTLKTADRFRREDFEQDTLVDRYNPLREKIVFSLNVGAPDWSVELAQKSVDVWDQAFRQAGIGTKLELSKGRAEVGDIRANVLNMIGDVDGNEPYWGVAPKVVDSDTGEVISSTANVNLMSIIYRGDMLVEQYLRARSGKLKNSYFLGIPIPSFQASDAPTEMLGANQANSSRPLQTQNIALDGLKFSGADTVTGNILKEAFVFDASKMKNKLKRSGSLSAFHSESSFSNEGTFEAVNNAIIPELEAFCPEVKALGDQIASGTQVDHTTEEFKKIRRACSMEVSKSKVIATLVHEMGHNFGLRHNFRGSNDWVNYFPDAQGWRTIIDPSTGKLNLPTGVAPGAPVKVKGPQGQELISYNRSSSIMEYPSYNHDSMITPGPYDVAAIRWAYTGTVLDTNDKVVKVNDKEPLVKQVGQTMRRFAFCTDEDIDYYGRDSMCIRHDEGTSVVEIAQATINQFNSYLASNYQKLDRDKLSLPEEAQQSRFFDLVLPLLRIYQDWRSMVSSEVGYSNAYLEQMSLADYEKLLTRMTTVTEDMSSEQKAYRAHMARYRKAADLTFEFLVNLAFQPDYTCIVERGQGDTSDVALLTFAILQRDIFSKTGVTAATCKDEAVDQFLKAKFGPKTTVTGGGGLSAKDLRYDLSDSAIENGPDRIGILNNKAFAVYALIVRRPLFSKSAAQGFAPNFLDEPHYRNAFSALVSKRMELGLNSDVFSASGAKAEKPVASPVFENEKQYLVYLYSSLKEGLAVPGKLEVTNRRLEAFTVLPSYYRSFSDMSEVNCARLQGIDFCAGPENAVSRSLLKALSKIQAMRSSRLPSEEAQKLFLTIVKPLVPATFTENTEYPALNFVKLIGTLQAAEAGLRKANNAALADDLAILIQALLRPELVVFNASLNRRLVKANSESSTDLEFLQKRQEIFKLDLIKTASEALDDSSQPLKFQLSYEALVSRMARATAIVKELNRLYQNDKTELDAQADVLMQAVFLR